MLLMELCMLLYLQYIFKASLFLVIDGAVYAVISPVYI